MAKEKRTFRLKLAHRNATTTFIEGEDPGVFLVRDVVLEMTPEQFNSDMLIAKLQEQKDDMVKEAITGTITRIA